MSEHQEQCAVVQWARMPCNIRRYPYLDLLHAIPNAAKRSYKLAAMMKAEGLLAGIPDLSLPVRQGKYYGLYIEMKHGKNKPTASQKWAIGRLREAGYRVEVCYTGEEAIELIKDYYG